MIRTRFAPSPTGYLHIGGLRTALYAYALAKHNKGEFVLRIEDTDQKRLVEGAVDSLLEALDRYHLHPDEGPRQGGEFAPYIQSERVAENIYKPYAQKLLDEDKAFYCFCKHEDKNEILDRRSEGKMHNRDLNCRYIEKEEALARIKNGEKPAIRLKTPDNETIGYTDPITKKHIKWNTSEVPDAMLLKSDGFPTYHLAVVVDDLLMQISHVLRGHDWLPSTPIHLLVYKYLGIDLPEFIHLTDILDPIHGGKLSKRKGSVSVEDFDKDGFLPEALLNFIMLLGWAPKDNQELFTLDEFVKRFDLDGLQKSNPQFNRKKLFWFNSTYIKNLSKKEFTSRALEWMKNYAPDSIVYINAKQDPDKFQTCVELEHERVKTLAEIPNSLEFFYTTKRLPELSEIKQLKDLSIDVFDEAKTKLRTLFQTFPDTHEWTHEKWETSLRKLADELELKHGVLFMILRILITFVPASPPLYESMVILGKEEVLNRLK